MTLMTLLALLIVLAIEYYFRWGAEYRNFSWLNLWRQKLTDWFLEQTFLSGWGGLLLILVTPVLALLIFVNLFSGPLYLLISFLLACCVLFLSLGPKPLVTALSDYLEAKERGDLEAADLSLRAEFGDEKLDENQNPIRNATEIILYETQLRYFSVIFWFVTLGPFGALFYRLAYEYAILCRTDHANNAIDDNQSDTNQGENILREHSIIIDQLIDWLEWLPARLTGLIFLLAGDFVKSFPILKNHLVDFSSNNQSVVIEIGKASLGLNAQTETSSQENSDVIGLIKRTFIIYLVLIAMLSSVIL